MDTSKPYIVALLTESGCVPPYIFDECSTEKEGQKSLKRLRKMRKDEIKRHFHMDDDEATGSFELMLIKREDDAT